MQVIAVRSGANDGPPSDEVMGTAKVPNTSAVGLPMITGTAEVGETLTAETSGITDVDGLINVSYRYRWIRVDGNDETDIADATDSTYVLVTDDAGTTLKVEVTFTDDADHEQTLVSAPTQVIQDLRPYVTLASPNSYHLDTLGLGANEATGRPVTLVVVFSAEVTGLQAEEFVIENGEVTDVYWVDCLSNPSRVRWCIVMQPADAQDERMTLTIPENIADGGNQPAPEVYYAVLRGTAPTGTFTTAAVEPVSRDFLARLTFDQDMLEDAPGTETLVFPEEEYLKSLDFQVPVEAVARITDFTHADDGSTIQVRIYPPGLLYQEPMSVVLPAGAALSETGYPNPELKLEVLVDTFTGSTLEALALTDLEFSPALDFATIRDHAASVGNEVVATEVTATPTVAGAIVEIEPPDADPDTVGHQVALDVGDTTVTVTVKDANSPDLVTGGSVNKSWQQTYNVVITRAPAKVSLARTGAVQNVEEGKPAPFTLTRIGDQTQPLVVLVEVAGEEWLSPGNWPTQVTIPIGATVHDFTVQTSDDDVERDNGAITVRVLAGSEYELTDADAGEASIRIHDNDTQSLLLSHSSLEVPEAGSANYTVKLVSEPSADVTVDITGHSGTDLTLDPASASLTFTTTNWATAQTVVVSAARDDDTTNDSATLTHTASGGDYDSLTQDLPVTILDAGTAATGQPAIEGTARVGETLTATIGTIADDVDGLPTGPFPTGYDFQWVRVDALDNETDIGTNSNNYTLMDADIGSTIRVEVSFTDSAGNEEEPLVSNAYPANGTVLAGGGICDRTAEVRDFLVNLISGVSDCAEVTDTHLAGITGTLNLISINISTLKAGDFAGLKAVSFLYLHGNNLMTLPLGVFDGLDALKLLDLRENDLATLPEEVFDGLDELTGLSLESNGLATLPADLFDGLDALSTLHLNDNDLATLPADLFDKLTALTDLQLNGNPGADFSPTADALPDDRTVPPAGGTVELDGSGSDGGPWGTNVTYSWSQTSGPTSGVTFDDDTSATTVVTITAPTAGTVLTFTLTVTGRATDRRYGTAPGTDTATVTVLSTDATLSTLTVNDGTTDHTIDLTTTPYTQTVGNTVTTVTLTATPAHTGASVSAVTLAGGTIDDDVFTDGITVPSLIEGANVIVVTVTAEDGVTVRTYTLTVAREVSEDGDATGKPTISGAAQVGVELTATTSGIMDADGKTNADNGVTGYAYTYQWILVDGTTETDIAGETGSTYTPVATDVGHRIKVRVSFTDDAGNPEEPLPSDATVAAVVAAAEDCAVDRPGNDWCATMTVGVSRTGSIIVYGFLADSFGQLDYTTIDYGPSYGVEWITANETGGNDYVAVSLSARVPLGSVFNLGGREFTADADSEQGTLGLYNWNLPTDFGWIDGQKVTVSANLSPAPESATVDGTTLVLTHAEDLDTNSSPAPGSYTVKLDGSDGPDVSGVSVGVRTVTLTLATPVTATDTDVTVDYDAPVSSPLQDVSGLDAPDSEDFPVTNNTGASTCLAPNLAGRDADLDRDGDGGSQRGWGSGGCVWIWAGFWGTGRD